MFHVKHMGGSFSFFKSPSFSLSFLFSSSFRFLASCLFPISLFHFPLFIHSYCIFFPFPFFFSSSSFIRFFFLIFHLFSPDFFPIYFSSILSLFHVLLSHSILFFILLPHVSRETYALKHSNSPSSYIPERIKLHLHASSNTLLNKIQLNS